MFTSIYLDTPLSFVGVDRMRYLSWSNFTQLSHRDACIRALHNPCRDCIIVVLQFNLDLHPRSVQIGQSGVSARAVVVHAWRASRSWKSGVCLWSETLVYCFEKPVSNNMVKSSTKVNEQKINWLLHSISDLLNSFDYVYTFSGTATRSESL